MATFFFALPLALGLLSTSLAATFEPPKFHWKDAWTYQISKTTQGVVAAPYRTEHSTMYTVANGILLTDDFGPTLAGQVPAVRRISTI
jgi:hypothetical protein